MFLSQSLTSELVDNKLKKSTDFPGKSSLTSNSILQIENIKLNLSLISLFGLELLLQIKNLIFGFLYLLVFSNYCIHARRILFARYLFDKFLLVEREQ